MKPETRNALGHRRRFQTLGEDAAIVQTDAGRRLEGVDKNEAPLGFLRTRLGRTPSAEETEWFRQGWRAWIEHAEEQQRERARLKARKARR